MDSLDLSYRLAVSLAGAAARACARGLPAGWRLRLEAEAPELPADRWVWLHAVSMGELLLADGLVGRLRDAGYRVHLSTGTPAGLELLTRRLPGWDAGTGRVSGGAFPLDDAAGLESFLQRPPGAFIALETELWPGLLEALEGRGVPRLVVNGRLTERSLTRGGPWLRRAAARLTLVAARDEASADAFRRLGAPTVALGGNLKADLPPPRPLHSGWHRLRAGWADGQHGRWGGRPHPGRLGRGPGPGAGPPADPRPPAAPALRGGGGSLRRPEPGLPPGLRALG